MKSTIVKLLLSSVVLLSACSTSIKHVIVNPELNIVSSHLLVQKQAQLKVTDLRSRHHIVQILREQQAPELVTAQSAITSIVEKTLAEALKNQGLQIQPAANNQIEVIIDTALVSVEQTLLKYSASNHIEIRVVINNSQGSLQKVFKITGNSHGPLKADLAVLERDFNQQLEKLLTQVVQSSELQAFIQ